MRMCQTLVGFLHCLKVKDTSKPPSRNGETSDSSESDSEASSVSSEEGKEKHKEKQKAQISSPPYGISTIPGIDGSFL